MNSTRTGYAHQLPPLPPPQQQLYQSHSQQQKPALRPRSKSGFSFHSHKSDESSGSLPKVDLHETPREKASRRLSTKADPRLAISEAEPSAVASDHSSSLAPLRAIQHRDANGNPIADPDRSNPTRSRWERPLDTIRAFEAAIDGNYARKLGRSEPPDSRRTSYYGGSSVGMAPPKPYQGNSYNGRSQQTPNDVYDNGRNNGPSTRLDSYYDNNYNNNGYYPNRQRYPRTASEPFLNNSTGVYPPNGNQASYETVTTASGSGSSGDPLGYTTDPSSEDSSYDRLPAVPRHESSDGYNNYPQQNGQFGGSYPAQSNRPFAAATVSPGYQNSGYGPPQNRPLPPIKSDTVPPRVPIKLGKNSSGGSTHYNAAPPANDKRKSWFGKRFSKA